MVSLCRYLLRSTNLWTMGFRFLLLAVLLTLSIIVTGELQQTSPVYGSDCVASRHHMFPPVPRRPTVSIDGQMREMCGPRQHWLSSTTMKLFRWALHLVCSCFLWPRRVLCAPGATGQVTSNNDGKHVVSTVTLHTYVRVVGLTVHAFAVSCHVCTNP